MYSAGRPLDPWFAFQSVLPRLAAADAAAEDLSPAAVRRTGARIILAQVACLQRLAAVNGRAAPDGGGRRGDSDRPAAAAGLIARSLAALEHLTEDARPADAATPGTGRALPGRGVDKRRPRGWQRP